MKVFRNRMYVKYSQFIFQVITWPTANGINETTATSICVNFVLDTGVGSTCLSDILGNRPLTSRYRQPVSIYHCVEDIGVSLGTRYKIQEILFNVAYTNFLRPNSS